ncbi:Hypothetical predicted protein [Pelobates cultripes]|uniref:Uncharacterized protein n=1 Tax=Pelobates cultripes TaxID=61616 RepID=A0AAD1WBS1_PELCU|nr:Hypothetical predicted protein [Pelobates cultripes]
MLVPTDLIHVPTATQTLKMVSRPTENEHQQNAPAYPPTIDDLLLRIDAAFNRFWARLEAHLPAELTRSGGTKQGGEEWGVNKPSPGTSTRRKQAPIHKGLSRSTAPIHKGLCRSKAPRAAHLRYRSKRQRPQAAK